MPFRPLPAHPHTRTPSHSVSRLPSPEVCAGAQALLSLLPLAPVIVLQEQSAVAGLAQDQDKFQYRKPVADSIKNYWGPKVRACRNRGHRTRIALYQTWGYFKKPGKPIKYASLGWSTTDEMQAIPP